MAKLVLRDTETEITIEVEEPEDIEGVVLPRHVEVTVLNVYEGFGFFISGDHIDSKKFPAKKRTWRQKLALRLR